MLEWLSENRTWVFSGIGISIIAMAFKLLKQFFYRILSLTSLSL